MKPNQQTKPNQNTLLPPKLRTQWKEENKYFSWLFVMLTFLILFALEQI